MQANEGNSLAQLGTFRSRGPPEAMRCFNRTCSLTDVRPLRHVHVSRTRKALSGSRQCLLLPACRCIWAHRPKRIDGEVDTVRCEPAHWKVRRVNSSFQTPMEKLEARPCGMKLTVYKLCAAGELAHV